MTELPLNEPASNAQSTPHLNVNWDLLLDSIEREDCIVCIGPGVFTENNKTLEERLSENLREQKDSLRIRVYDDGWYHFLDKRQWAQTWYAIKKFYELPCKTAESLLSDLSQIKFGIYMSLTPDYKMRYALEQSRGIDKFIFGSYIKKEPYKPIQNPSAQKPLVYNLLGEIGIKSSIVHTYEDMYQYLESVFEGNSMPPELKEKLINAEHYLFIGLPFDRWYMHLFLHMLKQNEYEGRTKYAPSNLVLNEIEEQYNITFVPTASDLFVKELYRRCKARNLLFANDPNDPNSTDQQPGPAANLPQIALLPEIAAIKTLIRKDDLDIAFSEFRDFIITSFAPLEGRANELMNYILLEESNYNRLKKSTRTGEISETEFDQKLRSVSFKLLEYLDEVQNYFYELFPPK